MRAACILGLLVAGLLVLSAAGLVHAIEAWALYDNFNGTTVDPSKWIGSEVYNHGGDANRILLSGTLRLRYSGYAETTSNSGGVGSALRLNFINPDPITAVKATINVVNYGMVGCPGNADFGATQLRARFFGAFFNAGTPAAGSDLNNVYAQFRLRRNVSDTVDTFRVEGFVHRCDDATCATYTGSPLISFGTVPKGTAATLSVIWDKPNKKFIFQSGVTTQEYVYVWPDTQPPSYGTKRLEAYTGVANCASGPRPYVWFTTRFDDAYLNASAVTARAPRAPVAPENPASRADRW